MSKKDIKALQPEEFDWSDGKRAGSLNSVYQQVLSKIDDAITWYQTQRVAKRILGAFIRYAVIVLGTVAAALPTVAEMALKTNEPLAWWDRPGTATIAGVMVGALLMLDRFAGATSAWIRYTMAETSLKELRDELTISYAFERAQWVGQSEPSVEQTKHALAALQGFLSRANQTVHNETDQWKTEFQNALQQTEDYAKAVPKKPEEVVGTIKITNPDRLAGAWTVSFNSGSEQTGSDDSKSFRLTPGPVTVRIKAVIKANADGSQTREYTTETADMLAVGTAKIFSITLPPS